MRLLEHEVKAMLAEAGIPVPRGRVARTPEEAREVASELGVPVAVKAQVPVGKRGKAGGIKLASTPEEAEEAARAILSMEVWGHRPESVLVEEAVRVGAEHYLGTILDRSARRMVLMTTPYGGMDVEESAALHPEAMARVEVNPLVGLAQFQVRKLAWNVSRDPEVAKQLARVISAFWDLVERYDLLMAEINPLAVAEDGRILALDARAEVDDNSLFRHPQFSKRAHSANPRERMAEEAGVTYVELDGDVGTMANGAGLAMATMDLVAEAGGRPANFCDVGGGASAKAVESAMRVITSNPNVKVVLVNALCGITSGEDVARGIAEAVANLGLGPESLVVRLEGFRAEEGAEILREAGIEVYKDPMEAVREAVRRASV